MSRAVTLFLAGATACTAGHLETREERGPLLGAYDRIGDARPGGVRAQAQARGTSLKLDLMSFDWCKVEHVETFALDTVTERTVPGAGPALATGATAALAGLGLFLARGLFTQFKERNAATHTAYGLMAFGVPSAALGAVGLWRTGETVQTRKAEQVAKSEDAPCHERPFSGAVTWEPAAGLSAVNGELALSVEQVRNLDPAGPLVDGKPVESSPQARLLWEAFLACSRAPPAPPTTAAAKAMPLPALQEALVDLRACAELNSGAPASLDGLEKELAERSGTFSASFEEALAQVPPDFRISAAGPQRLLWKADEKDAPIAVEGVLVDRPEPNIAVVAVGGERALLFLPKDVRGDGGLAPQTRVQAVGVVVGWQTLGDSSGVLIRVTWMRPAYGFEGP